MDVTQPENQKGRAALEAWQQSLRQNLYREDPDLMHTVQYGVVKDFKKIDQALTVFGQIVAEQLEPLVVENNLAINLPRLEAYDGIGNPIDHIIHHPTYEKAGDLIYGTGLLANMAKPGGLLSGLVFFLLSSEAGEAGHNCPIACSAGMIRLFQKVPDFPGKAEYLKQLTMPSYQTNFTGAQFLTEIQGGSDVGLNASLAERAGSVWRITGEKWFCSNADAELILITARVNPSQPGTKGLGLFLVPKEWKGKRNHYTTRRLKDKLGTRSMATGEIDFHGAYAIPMEPLSDGIKLVMENVLHISRLFNSYTVLAMARRAYTIANNYAKHRIAFDHAIIHYPLVSENLAKIKAENTALLAGIFATTRLQDEFDLDKKPDKNKQLLLRTLVNIQKYLTAKWSVKHIHHSLDVLAGNGTIETFSSIPRLFRDAIVCENWEGTHNVLRMQVMKDILKYKVDQLVCDHIHETLNGIKNPSNDVNDLKKALQLVEEACLRFRQLDADLQSLQILQLIDRLAKLYVATQLLLEALDQMKHKSSSKYHCYQYFYRRHFAEKPLQMDQRYLELIDKILG